MCSTCSKALFVPLKFKALDPAPKGYRAMEASAPEWHFFIRCKNCGRTITLHKAPSPEEEWEPKSKGWTGPCPVCGHEDTYKPSEIARGVLDE